MSKSMKFLVIEFHTPGECWRAVNWWPSAGGPRTLENARKAIAKASIPPGMETSEGFRIIQRTVMTEDRVIDKPSARNNLCACLGVKGCYCNPYTEEDL